MKILEVRDGFIKIESSEKIAISSFLEVKGLEKRYIAQVIRSKNNGTGYNIYAKLIFVHDGSLMKYDKTMPDISAEVSRFPFDTVNNSFSYSNPIVAGKFISDGDDILLDSENFDNKTIISIDSPESNNILVQNLANQFKQQGKTLIIDMLGVIEGDKYVAGRDFKLPLNAESLRFLYEDCLNDATADSKSLIKEIFIDLSQYAQEVKFLPFSTLKAIVDDMVEKSHIFKLLVLKNKLAKFEAAGYFAANPSDADNLSQILCKDFAVIDLSKVDTMFQNRYLSLILSGLKSLGSECFVLAEVSNAITKKNIKDLLHSENLHSTFVTHSKFKYLADLKPLFKNYFIENTYTNKEIFRLYAFFIEAMTQNEYLIVGEGTNFVPVISRLEKYEVEIRKLYKDPVAEEVMEASYDVHVADDLTGTNCETKETITDEDESTVIEELPADNLIAEVNDSPENPDEAEVDEPDNIENNDKITSIFADDEDECEDETGEEEQDTSEEDEFAEVSDMSEPSELAGALDGNEEISEQESLTQEEDVAEEGSATFTEIHGTEPETDSIVEEIEIPSDLAEDLEESEAEISGQDDVSEPNIDEIESEQSSLSEVLPLENQEDEIGEFEEVDVSDIDDADILVDIDDMEQISSDASNYPTEIHEEQVDKDIVEDVDRVFSTIKDDEISDTDLDLIDALNGNEAEDINLDSDEAEMFTDDDMEILQELDSGEEEEEFVEPLEEISDSDKNEPEHEILERRESSTPMVPIYDAGIPDEDRVVSDDIEQGDTVMHAKYGSGVVEKMIKYGNKNLYSINFENVGRRLLDPNLTEIKKA